MQNTIIDSASSKWFARLDSEVKPTQLMLYNFVGAKFEAHCIPLDNAEKIRYWMAKIYQFEQVRQVIELIIFDAAYPDELFEQFKTELCRIRDEQQK